MKSGAREDIAPAFEALKDRADALYVVVDPLMNTNRSASTPWRSRRTLPTMLRRSASMSKRAA